jgi:hypothetical protein
MIVQQWQQQQRPKLGLETLVCFLFSINVQHANLHIRGLFFNLYTLLMIICEQIMYMEPEQDTKMRPTMVRRAAGTGGPMRRPATS